MNKNWTVVYQQWNQKEHPLQEALCTLGNGYFTNRGALEMEKDNGYNYPGTYLAGGYNRMESKVQDKVIENEDLVNWPNWLYMTFRVGDGNWFSLEDVDILELETRLYLQDGILERRMRFRDGENRVTGIRSKRLVSMDNCHAASLQWELTPENWSGKLILRSGIDGQVINNNVERYSQLNQDHVRVVEQGSLEGDRIFLVSKAKQSRVLMAQAIRTQIFVDGKNIGAVQEVTEDAGFIAGDFLLSCEAGKSLTIEKSLALFSSRDFAISDPLTEAKTMIGRLGPFRMLESRQSMAWQELWKYNNMDLQSGNGLDQLVVRLHIFHLYQTASHNSIDCDIGVPARGWHGEGYRGHIFWDELYILPFINLHQPKLAQSLLMYRYRRLPEARYAAKTSGYRGAMFPWQSGSNGREETQQIHLNPKSGRWLPDVSHLQYHINAAIPYNVWHYYQSTGDMDFLLSHGAEIILSTALFWSSVAQFSKKRERYEIRGVMGPDEYHTHYPDAQEPGLDNNAYTNVMAVWVLYRALDVLHQLGKDSCKELEEKVGYSGKDVIRWKDITEKMFVPLNDDGIIMQFEGYEKLKELDWDHYHEKHGNAMRLDRILESEGDSCNYYKASKQADVLMLFYLFSAEELGSMFARLRYDFDPETIPPNIEYYRKRTAHGSTLSQVIHAWVYARSHREESWKRFREALMSDFRDVQGGTTHEGIHLGAMAGTLDIIQRCYSGLEIRDEVLWFNPQLPEDIREMVFHLRYRGHWIKILITHDRLSLEFNHGWANPVTVGVNGKTSQMGTKDKKVFKLT